MGAFKNLAGLRFGRLVAISHSLVGKRIYWKCVCDCGAEITVEGSNLRSGNSRSCGCLHKELVSDRLLQDLTGWRFGRLLVLGISHRDENQKVNWRVRCDCNVVKTVQGGHLRSGATLSCGCLNRDTHTNHGHAARGQQSPEHRCWVDMNQRCYNPSHVWFAEYGGRGITVCKRWRDSFEHFLADMGPRPNDKTPSGHTLWSIDRINNEGNYTPGNCEWRTWEEQRGNQRPRKRHV